MAKKPSFIPELIKTPLFQGIAEEELASLIKCAGCIFRSYKKGEAVFQAGDFVREIGLVISGCVHIVKNDAFGNSNIFAEAASGEMFAESFVCGGLGLLPMTVLAAKDAEVMFFDFQRIITTCSSACMFHTILIRNMVGIFARKNMLLTEKMDHITKRTTREKLLSYLSEQSARQGRRSFEIPFNRQELADYLSVDRSALSAEMSKLKAEAVIMYKKNHFELLTGSDA
ncbi:MAG: Crp/Fnr family transcriptional regulator [Deltaproteobacteria bacterium]|jgi:CRP-like cAMP-binding protein|nr:Crp/Fnr family transcriptional regulator [Deltaproteobacteria bacterium]